MRRLRSKKKRLVMKRLKKATYAPWLSKVKIKNEPLSQEMLKRCFDLMLVEHERSQHQLDVVFEKDIFWI